MEKTLEEWYARRNMCVAFKKLVDQTNDPRRPEALKKLNEQLAIIDKYITEITGSPPDITVGLKTGILFGKSANIK